MGLFKWIVVTTLQCVITVQCQSKGIWAEDSVNYGKLSTRLPTPNWQESSVSTDEDDNFVQCYEENITTPSGIDGLSVICINVTPLVNLSTLVQNASNISVDGSPSVTRIGMFDLRRHPSLVALSVVRCGLMAVEHGALSWSDRLTHLNLSFNHLTTLSWKIFDSHGPYSLAGLYRGKADSIRATIMRLACTSTAVHGNKLESVCSNRWLNVTTGPDSIICRTARQGCLTNFSSDSSDEPPCNIEEPTIRRGNSTEEYLTCHAMGSPLPNLCSTTHSTNTRLNVSSCNVSKAVLSVANDTLPDTVTCVSHSDAGVSYRTVKTTPCAAPSVSKLTFDNNIFRVSVSSTEPYCLNWSYSKCADKTVSRVDLYCTDYNGTAGSSLSTSYSLHHDSSAYFPQGYARLTVSSSCGTVTRTKFANATPFLNPNVNCTISHSYQRMDVSVHCQHTRDEGQEDFEVHSNDSFDLWLGVGGGLIVLFLLTSGAVICITRYKCRLPSSRCTPTTPVCRNAAEKVTAFLYTLPSSCPKFAEGRLQSGPNSVRVEPMNGTGVNTIRLVENTEYQGIADEK